MNTKQFIPRVMIQCFHFKDKQFISSFDGFEGTGLIAFCRIDSVGIGNRLGAGLTCQGKR